MKALTYIERGWVAMEEKKIPIVAEAKEASDQAPLKYRPSTTQARLKHDLSTTQVL